MVVKETFFYKSKTIFLIEHINQGLFGFNAFYMVLIYLYVIVNGINNV